MGYKGTVTLFIKPPVQYNHTRCYYRCYIKFCGTERTKKGLTIPGLLDEFIKGT